MRRKWQRMCRKPLGSLGPKECRRCKKNKVLHDALSSVGLEPVCVIWKRSRNLAETIALESYGAPKMYADTLCGANKCHSQILVGLMAYSNLHICFPMDLVS